MAALSSIASATSEDNGFSEEFKQRRRENDAFWHEISSFYKVNTTGAITKEEMGFLPTTFAPSNIQRFASVHLANGNQEWISENNAISAAGMAAAILPTMVDGGLPTDIPEWFEGDFFSNPSHVAALNSLYIENNANYNPFFPIPEISNFADGKSNSTEKELANNTKSKMVVHPNPFKTHITFDLSAYAIEGDNNRIEFYDLLGKKVFETQIAEKQDKLMVQSVDLPTGVVLYKLYLDGIEAETGKIIHVE